MYILIIPLGLYRMKSCRGDEQICEMQGVMRKLSELHKSDGFDML